MFENRGFGRVIGNQPGCVATSVCPGDGSPIRVRDAEQIAQNPRQRGIAGCKVNESYLRSG